VPARDALARSLRAADRSAAEAVRKLRKPTVAAWGLNSVARADPAAVDDLLAAGDVLRAAQEAALRGDAAGLRSATEARRRAVGALAARVAELLGSAPAGVAATLEAATVDPEVGALLRAGRLDRERSAAAAGFGFGEIGDWTPPPRPAPPEPEPGPEPEPEPDADADADADDAALASAVEEAQQRAAELHDAEEAVARLKASLADATAALRTARTRANKAELHAEALRQRAWEQGEQRRRERRPDGESDPHAS
jgi:hypothetical protein